MWVLVLRNFSKKKLLFFIVASFVVYFRTFLTSPPLSRNRFRRFRSKKSCGYSFFVIFRKKILFFIAASFVLYFRTFLTSGWKSLLLFKNAHVPNNIVSSPHTPYSLLCNSCTNCSEILTPKCQTKNVNLTSKCSKNYHKVCGDEK